MYHKPMNRIFSAKGQKTERITTSVGKVGMGEVGMGKAK